jgi:ribulose bisphosphate carboxylase small subunit
MHTIEKTFPIIITSKFSFNLFVYREKSKFVREKWKMTLDLHVQFNGSAVQAIYNLATDREQIWLRPGKIPPKRARHKIQKRKIMVTIVWNPLGFPLILALSQGHTWNAEYYRDNIVAALTQL